ncbi:hypothetical protein ABNX05_05030 [Lysinibacillus sp. M3]|uniref:RNA-binding protein n=1 Tax=Lysinibacillus zambalensis TaxID=3160866 RepID=A0ABV1MN89_9BACI
MNDFDRNFKRASRAIGVIFVVNILISLTVLGGFGWLVYVLLKHFGIIG